MKRSTITTLGAAVLIGASVNAFAETMKIREISHVTYSGTINDEKNHPVLIIDDLKKPRPIGPGRGAGGYVFLNNKLFDWETNEPLGMVRGECMTLDHGPDGPWQGEVVIGAGGPFDANCNFNYMLDGGQLVAQGNIDLNAMELDKSLSIAITGGTGKYVGAWGEVTVTQDPPGQPITYRVEVEYHLPESK